MNEMLQAGIYLKAILPLMEDLVQYDQESAAAIQGRNLVLQFEVKRGPVAHLEIRGGRVRHNTGPHPRPDVRLSFKSPELLNRLFAGANVRPGIRKGFTRLGFLTRGFAVLSRRLSYYLEGEGKNARGPDADRFLVRLGLHAMLGGMATVASDDPSLTDIAAGTSPGTLLVQVLPDGPHGTFAKTVGNGDMGFRATWEEPVEHANAVMEFVSLGVARQVIDGQLSPVAAIGTGEMHIRGYLPLIEKANIFLGRFSRLMGR
jgi:hypothetical protein